jgi:hypothetical protein
VEHPTVSADQGESGDSRTFLERLYGGGAYEAVLPNFPHGRVCTLAETDAAPGGDTVVDGFLDAATKV